MEFAITGDENRKQPQKNNLKILDLATGTGQIMFNIKKERHELIKL